MARWLKIAIGTTATALLGVAVWGCCGVARHIIIAVDHLGDAGTALAQTAARLNDPHNGTLKMIDEDVGATKSLIVHADLVARHEQQQLDIWDQRGDILFANANGAVSDLRTTLNAATGTLNESTQTMRGAGPALADLDSLIRSFDAAAPDMQRAMKGIASTSAQTAGISRNLNATTHDLQVALHPILDPAPCKTRGCKIKRSLREVRAVGPAVEGLWYLLHLF